MSGTTLSDRINKERLLVEECLRTNEWHSQALRRVSDLLFQAAIEALNFEKFRDEHWRKKKADAGG